jgi:acyl-CoA thioester hydrolase
LNNSVYNLLFDTIINKYLIEKCNLQPNAPPSTLGRADPIALVIESHANFLRPLSFPSRVLLGMRVLKLGKSSVTYEVGVFGPLKEGGQGEETALSTASTEDPNKALSVLLEDGSPAVVGGFTHVFVSRDTRRPVKNMPLAVIQGLAALEKAGEALSRL